MNIAEPFIRRPVGTTLIMVALLLAGMLAYNRLPVSALPQVDYPTIQVRTFQPGASPEVMAATVSSPLERQFGQMPGLVQMTSTSAQGASVIVLQFQLELSLDVAEQQVQAAINAAFNFLPRDLPNPPVYSKVNPADAPVLTLAFSSDELPIQAVQDLADTRIAQKLSQLPGVGLVTLAGGKKPAVRIHIDPRRVAALGLGLEVVRAAVATANVNQAKGSLDGERLSYVIGADDRLFTALEYGRIVLAAKGASVVRLSDVAELVDDVEDPRQAAWMNKTPAVVMNIQRRPGANVIETVDRIKAILPQLKAALPGSVTVSVLGDRTESVRASIADVQGELVLAAALVVFVIYLFLGDPRAAAAPAAAVPLSLVGTFGIMHLAGFSVNNLTLMALTISTGFVVDDAIVMIENIARFVEEGERPFIAALKGAKQIGFTIVSLTVSLIAVLIPLLFMSDVVGRLFREFSVTLGASILLSAAVSLSLTPMMCAHLLKSRETAKPSRVARALDASFKALSKLYAATLKVSLAHRGLVLFVAVLVTGLSGYLYVKAPKGFFPVQDSGAIIGLVEGDPKDSFAALTAKTQALVAAILEDPDVENVSSFLGVDGVNETAGAARILVALKPHRDRPPAKIIQARLERSVAKIAHVSLHLSPVQDLTVDASLGKAPYRLTLDAVDQKLLDEYARRLEALLQSDPNIKGAAVDDFSGAAVLSLSINRDAAARLGVTVQAIDDALYSAFGGRFASTIFTELNQYRVVLAAPPRLAAGPAALNNVHVRTASGAFTPVTALVSVVETTGPLAVRRQDQFPVIGASFDAAPGKALGDAVAAAEKALAALSLPPGVHASFQGAAKAFLASLDSQPLLILAALVTVYIVLGVLYESFIHPVTILSTLPSAGVGAVLALHLFGEDLGVPAVIGLVLLIGIVKKNGIMMVDFALEAERAEGLPPEEAVYKACLLRFRPILMTTFAALLGALPLALGGGVGSELRRPLGLTIIGGLLLSQILTLYTTPAIYLAFDALGRRARRGRTPERDLPTERE